MRLRIHLGGLFPPPPNDELFSFFRLRPFNPPRVSTKRRGRPERNGSKRETVLAYPDSTPRASLFFSKQFPIRRRSWFMRLSIFLAVLPFLREGRAEIHPLTVAIRSMTEPADPSAPKKSCWPRSSASCMQALKQIFLFCNLDQAADLLMNPGHWSLWWRSRAGFRAHRQSCVSSLSGRRQSCRCYGFRPCLPWPTYVSHCRGIDHDVFKINAFHRLLSCSKSSDRTPLLNQRLDLEKHFPICRVRWVKPSNNPVGKHTKDGDEKRAVVLGGAASISQNGRQYFHHTIECFFAKKRCGMLVVCFSFRFSCAVPLSREFFLGDWQVKIHPFDCQWKFKVHW